MEDQVVQQKSPSEKDGCACLSSDMTKWEKYEVCPDSQWEVDRKRLKLMEVIGSGAFGVVWKAILLVESNNGATEIPVAVKKVKSCATEKDLVALVEEMKMFNSIDDHENVLRLLGCCTGVGPLYLLLELCENGNLRDFLRAHRPKDGSKGAGNLEPRVLIDNMTQHHLVQFACQVAKGMEYISSKKIVHGNLAARHVLVTGNNVMKIADCGRSRDVPYGNCYMKKGLERLPYKWLALECLDEKQVSTIQSDVWSFGILLWEIMTMGGTPYPTIAMEQLFDCLKNGYRMEAPNNCPQEIYQLMTACWLENGEARPTFKMIYHYLEWMLSQQEVLEEQEPQHSTCADEGSLCEKEEDGELDDEGWTLLSLSNM